MEPIDFSDALKRSGPLDRLPCKPSLDRCGILEDLSGCRFVKEFRRVCVHVRLTMETQHTKIT